MPRSAQVTTASVLVLLVLPALGALPVSAQQGGPAPLSRTQYGIGYVANAPDEIVGGGAYVLSPKRGGIGLYVDAKFDVSDPTGERGFDASVTSSEVANEVGGKYVESEESWRSFNVAVVRPLSASLMVYVGGGLAKKKGYDLYQVDPSSPVGVSGVVWTENLEAAETKPNLMVGTMMRLTRRVTTHFGYETRPKGLTVGASLRLPAW